MLISFLFWVNFTVAIINYKMWKIALEENHPSENRLLLFTGISILGMCMCL